MFKKNFNVSIIITLIVYIGLICWFSYAVYVLNQASVYAENGVLENTQAFTLIIACLIFFIPTVSQHRTDKLILGFFSFLCLNFALREVNVGELDVPDILKLFFSGNGRKLMIATGFISMFIYALFHRAHYKNEIIKFLFSKKNILMGVAAIFLFMSGFFEEASSIPHYVFLEELVELFAYILILLVALIYSKNNHLGVI